MRVVDADFAFHRLLGFGQFVEQRPLQLDQLRLAPKLRKDDGEHDGLAAAHQGGAGKPQMVAATASSRAWFDKAQASFNRPKSSFTPSDHSR